MGKYKNLLNNTIIFAIGNISTRLIWFILLPLYTFYLSTSEVGIIDLIITTTNLLIPIFSLCIYDAALRLIIDSEKDSNKIICSSLFVVLVSGIVSIILYPLLKFTVIESSYHIYFFLSFLLQMINNLFLNITRATNKIKLFAVNSFLTAVTMLILAIIFLQYFSMGIEGYFLSIIGSTFLSILTLFVVGKFYRAIRFENVDKTVIRLMILFSLPLIPNATMWWITQFLDRYMITFFLGVEANGIYAIANKIPNLIMIANLIFFQAWQLSAIQESQSEKKATFFTNVFSVLFSVLILSTSGVLLILRPLMSLLVSEEFIVSWRFAPFLIVSVIFSSFSTFLGTNYLAMNKTTGVLKTSVAGAMMNIILNILLIPRFGINGASFSTMISVFLIWILRIVDTKRFVIIKINFFQFIISFILIFLQIGSLYFNSTFTILFGLFFLVLLVFLQIPTYMILYNLINRSSRN